MQADDYERAEGESFSMPMAIREREALCTTICE